MIFTAAGAHRVPPSSRPPSPRRAGGQPQPPAVIHLTSSGQTASFLTPTRLFVLCVCNLRPEENSSRLPQKYSLIEKCHFLIKHLCVNSSSSPSRVSKPFFFFFLEKIHWGLCVFLIYMQIRAHPEMLLQYHLCRDIFSSSTQTSLTHT